MSKTIAKYADQAAYTADAANRSTIASVASSIGQASQFDAKNVIVDFDAPGKEAGDAAYYDSALGKVVLVKAGTLDPANLDTDRFKDLHNTCIGHIYGKDVFVDDRQLSSEKYATPDEWKLSGFDLSQAGSAEITFKYYSASGGYVKNLTLSWAAGADISTIRSQISSAAGIKDYCQPFAIDASSFGVNINGYNSNIGLTLVSGDITVECTHRGYQTQYYPGLPYDPQAQTNDNVVGNSLSPRVQKEKAAEYWATSGATPTEAVTLMSAAVTKAAFDASEFCEDMREMFCDDPENPTDAEYDAYIYASIDKRSGFRYPTPKSTNHDFAFGDNSDNSRTLALVSHVRSDGETIYDFPNAHSAHLLGTTIEGAQTGFEPGTGHLGGNTEAYLLYSRILKAQTDPINVAIAKKSGTKVSYNTTTRLAFQSYSCNAWFFYGSSGSLYCTNVRCAAFPARVFRAFPSK